MVEVLIDRGADVNLRSNGGLPVDYAIYFGHADVADRLVAAGADDPRPAGRDWADIDFWAEGEGQAEEISEELGLDPWVGSGWWRNLNHLWFLWLLTWLIAGFVLVASVVDRLVPSVGGTSGAAVWVMWAFVPLTLLPQLLMGEGGDVRVFGPDTSTSWVPIWHVLAYYAVFFGFGALLYGRPNRQGGQLVETIGRWWPILLPFTVVAFLVTLDLPFDENRSWLAASVGQVVFAWLAIVTLMGLFATLLARERRGVRYLSDSAYWLYLAHLPIVIWGQVWIRNWELPAVVKFAGLTTVVTVLLLASYEYLVRYTALGALLNGRRTRPDRQPAGS